MAAKKTPGRPVVSGPGQRRPLTVKQERAARRAEKLAAFRREQARRRRNRRLLRIGAIVGGVAVLAVVVVLVVTSVVGRPNTAAKISGVKTFRGLSSSHVQGTVSYPQSPPVGGKHSATWLNCGVYRAAVPEVNGTHALEHGAVWVGYDPAKLNQARVDALVAALPKTKVIVSPFSGLASPIVVSAWGAQLSLSTASDPRLSRFVTTYLDGATAPEPGATCTGGLDGPSRVS